MLKPEFWAGRGWLLALAGLIICQGWLTLRLFGSEDRLDALTSNEPIISGAHALHLYHGYLEASTPGKRSRHSLYDPAFYAGYPKTPWFDSGSKLAEVFLRLAGGGYRPLVYKLGLAGCWLLLPLLVVAAGRAAGLSGVGSCLAGWMAMILCASEFGYEPLRSGDIDFLFGAGLAVLVTGLLLQYDSTPGWRAWLALPIVAWLLGRVHFGLLLGLMPAFLVYYVGSAGKHSWTWHLGMVTALATALLGNWSWVEHGARAWSLMSIEGLAGDPLITVPAAAWRSLSCRGMALAFLTSAALGLVLFHGRSQITAARTLGAGLLGLLLAGKVAQPFGWPGAGHSLFAVLLGCSVPAAHALAAAVNRLLKPEARAKDRHPFACASGFNVTLALMLLLAAGLVLYAPLQRGMTSADGDDPLPVGISDDAQAAMSIMGQQTNGEARILFEESPQTDSWSPLLSLLTDRLFIGGLGAEAKIEHAAMRLRDGHLAGKPVERWANGALAEYCRLYNVGWVICRSQAATGRFQKWPAAERIASLPSGHAFFRIRRTPSYFVVGEGEVVHCDSKRLTLADLRPVNGRVVLSFHYHAGIRPSLDHVSIEPEPQLEDAVPFMRVKLSEPLSHLTLFWQSP